MLRVFRLVSAIYYERLKRYITFHFRNFLSLVELGQKKKKGSVICRSTLRCRPAYQFVLSTANCSNSFLHLFISYYNFESRFEKRTGSLP